MKRKWLIALFIIVVAAMIAFLAIFVRRGEHDAPVSRVVISGQLDHIDASALEARIRPLVQGKDFFNVRLKQVAAVAQTIPWVGRAEVSRIWPNTIAVNITEQQALATWNQMGLVNRYGEIFYPPASSFPPKLVNFYKMNSRQDAQQVLIVLDRYQQMALMLKPLKLAPTTIRVDRDNSWEVTLSDGIKLQLGTKDVLTKLQRFVKVYSKVFAQHSKTPHVVDMRYPNGMAVQWK